MTTYRLTICGTNGMQTINVPDATEAQAISVAHGLVNGNAANGVTVAVLVNDADGNHVLTATS